MRPERVARQAPLSEAGIWTAAGRARARQVGPISGGAVGLREHMRPALSGLPPRFRGVDS